ncbi:hypothetical protein GGR57DRAFT_505974 [Xylariaceae sp. FL1272]|nr:hypothetical protein GGR57DRAFT_505974 [Xylariaceae sp. FL1272]
MAYDYTETNAVYAAIHSSKLRHTDPELIQSFVDDDFGRDRAISFMLRAYLDNTEPRAGFERFLVNWKRLLHFLGVPPQPLQHSQIVQDVTVRDKVCFSTRRNGSFVDPLVVVPIFPDIDRKSLIETRCLREMIETFLDPKHLDWLISLRYDAPSNATENLWLLSMSAVLAFSRGFNKFTPIGPYYLIQTPEVSPGDKPSFVKWWRSVMVSPPDIAHLGIRSPDQCAVTILSHFAHPIRWIHISHDLANQQTCRKQLEDAPPTSTACLNPQWPQMECSRHGYM